jgi:ribosomal protein S18 acetylase RimI-like enzyme
MPDQANSNIVIRPAGPDHGAIAAKLIYSTHPTLFDDLYQGDRALMEEVSAKIWEAKETIDSHTIAHGAYVDGQLVGLEVGGNNDLIRGRGEAEDAFVAQLIPTEINKEHKDRWRQSWLYAFPKFPDDTYYVGTLAVLPEWHGKGIGRLLLQNAFDRAKAMGCRDAQLDLYANNAAFHFYQAMGMEKLSENTVTTLLDTDTPTHYRMIIRFD